MKFSNNQVNNLLEKLRPAKASETSGGYAYLGNSCNHICKTAPWEDYSYCNGNC